MAARLANQLGTEEDKVNCPFYYKTGACRHGERCSRIHIKPAFSQSVLVPHMYQAPPPGPNGETDPEHFEDFYEEVFDEIAKFGEVEELNILENLGEHMVGNVYVKYKQEEDAEKCVKALGGRYYGGVLLAPEFSIVTNFREARCRQFDEASCSRGGYCNFMHIKRLSKHLRRKLRKQRTRSRSRSRDRDRGRDRGGRSRRDRSRSRDKGRDKSRRDRSRSRDRSRRDRSRRDRSPDKEVEKIGRSNSEERRAMIASWNTKKPDSVEEAANGDGEKPAPPAEENAAPPAEEGKE